MNRITYSSSIFSEKGYTFFNVAYNNGRPERFETAFNLFE